MSDGTEQNDITKQTVVHAMPGTEAVTVRRDLEYGASAAGALVLDVYSPPDLERGTRIPAVVLVAGYPDPGFAARLGCRFKDMGSSTSWARLIAASGLMAITYANREPAADLDALLRHLRENAADVGVDESRVGLWASSGNVPLALAALMREDRDFLRCAALGYGLMLDLDGSTSVAEAARTWGFANPAAEKAVADLPRETPLFLARAGQDPIPHLNETMDRFVAAALRCNLPLTLVNHPEAPHAFDLFHDSELSREIIRRILAFLRFHLLA